MQAVERVLPGGQRAKDGMMGEPVRQGQILGVARDGIDVGHRLGHAAMLGFQHSLHLRVGESVCGGDRPVGQLDQNALGLLVSAKLIRIAQARIELVQGVPRDPAGHGAIGGDFGERSPGRRGWPSPARRLLLPDSEPARRPYNPRGRGSAGRRWRGTSASTRTDNARRYVRRRPRFPSRHKSALSGAARR